MKPEKEDQSRMDVRLEREEFADALTKGLGRAFLHVSRHGLSNVADLVLSACVQNQSYDAQCESSRASWLYQLFGQSPQYAEFRDVILGRLEAETTTWNLLQLCGLAKEMAAHGDSLARQKLRVRVLEIASSAASDDWLGADLWIELEGAGGLLELARLYGKRRLSDPDDIVPDHFLSGSRAGELTDALRRQAEQEPEIKAYWDFLTARGVFNPPSVKVDKEADKQRRHEQARQRFTLEKILQSARSKRGQYPGSYTHFGRHATPEELQEIYAQLLHEPDDDVRVRLLWVFRRTPLPQLDEVLFRYADGSNDALKAASIAALAQTGDERVHALARAKVQAGRLVGADSEALDLFLKNYAQEDARLVTEALAGLQPNPEDAHSLGFSIIYLVEQYKDAELTNALRWAYEQTPCTNCRHRVLKQLRELNQLDNQLLYECQFDAEEDIRLFAQQQLGAA